MCNRLNSKRGAGGLGWRCGGGFVWVCGGVLRSGVGGVGSGDVQNDGIDDKYMQLCEESCSLCQENFVVGGHMCAFVSALEQSSTESSYKLGTRAETLSQFID